MTRKQDCGFFALLSRHIGVQCVSVLTYLIYRQSVTLCCRDKLMGISIIGENRGFIMQLVGRILRNARKCNINRLTMCGKENRLTCSSETTNALGNGTFQGCCCLDSLLETYSKVRIINRVCRKRPHKSEELVSSGQCLHSQVVYLA